MNTVLFKRVSMNPRGAGVVVEVVNGRYSEFMEITHYLDDKYQAYSFRRMRNERDALADWVHEERAEEYLGTEALVKAKERIAEAEQEMFNARAIFNMTSLREKMAQIVRATVKHFEDDFYLHDCTSLGLKGPYLPPFRWYVRECGTWLFFGDEGEFERAVLRENVQRRFNWTPRDGLVEIVS